MMDTDEKQQKNSHNDLESSRPSMVKHYDFSRIQSPPKSRGNRINLNQSIMTAGGDSRKDLL